MPVEYTLRHVLSGEPNLTSYIYIYIYINDNTPHLLRMSLGTSHEYAYQAQVFIWIAMLSVRFPLQICWALYSELDFSHSTNWAIISHKTDIEIKFCRSDDGPVGCQATRLAYGACCQWCHSQRQICLENTVVLNTDDNSDVRDMWLQSNENMCCNYSSTP